MILKPFQSFRSIILQLEFMADKNVVVSIYYASVTGMRLHYGLF